MPSFIVHTYQAGAFPPYHAYAYDAAGNPLTEQQANDLSERLAFWPSADSDLMIMVLPAEEAPGPEAIRAGATQPRGVTPVLNHQHDAEGENWRITHHGPGAGDAETDHPVM